MIVEKGIPKNDPSHERGHGHGQAALEKGVLIASSGVGRSANKRRAGLSDDNEPRSDEVDDEDDI